MQNEMPNNLEELMKSLMGHKEFQNDPKNIPMQMEQLRIANESSYVLPEGIKEKLGLKKEWTYM